MTIDEQIKELRELAYELNLDDNELADIIKEAADTIENLANALQSTK